MKTLKTISLFVLGIYYILTIAAKIALPHLVPLDAQYAVGLLLNMFFLFTSPLALLAILLIFISIYISYKREMIKPKVFFLIFLILLSWLPFKFTTQLLLTGNQIQKNSKQISVVYSNELPAYESTLLYVPSPLTKTLIENEYESYFTETKNDGTYYVSIYKKKNEEVDKYGYGRDFPTNRTFMYPNSYIEFSSFITTPEDYYPSQEENCTGMRGSPSGRDICNKIFDSKTAENTTITIYQLDASNAFRVFIKGKSVIGIVNFVNISSDYNMAKIIDISKSLMK